MRERGREGVRESEGGSERERERREGVSGRGSSKEGREREGVRRGGSEEREE